MRTIRFLILTLGFFISLAFSQTATAPAAGDGTSGNPYQIASLENLYWIAASDAVVSDPNQATRWAAHYIQTVNINATETSTWNDGAGWSPIGRDYTKISTNFTGCYDGQGHTIDSLFINRTESDHVGLFGYLNNATISDLGLTDIEITGGGDTGGLAGNLEGTTIITACYTTGTVTNASNPTGGLVGSTSGSTGISDCYSVCTVVGSNYVGGLAGKICSNASISSCYSSGAVSGSGNFIGGLIGQTSENSTVTNSYSTGTVTGDIVVGGLIGENWGDGILSKCYATGTISGNQKVGGLTGQFGSVTVSNCYSRGNVVRLSGSSDTCFGGFCGANIYLVTIQNCYSTGSVSYTGETNPTDKGFLGYEGSTGSYSNNFWDTQTSGQSTAIGATGRTTAQMKTVSTFTDSSWDFVGETTNGSNDYWDLDYSSAINNGYPYLAWQDGEDQSLPVELTSFSAVSQSTGVLLTWRTESETENLGFIIQRKTVGANHDSPADWSQIASYAIVNALAGHGSTSAAHEYAYTDAAVKPGTTYAYRLGDVDYSGAVTWHGEVEVEVKAEVEQMPVAFGLKSAYPNQFNPAVTIPYN